MIGLLLACAVLRSPPEPAPAPPPVAMAPTLPPTAWRARVVGGRAPRAPAEAWTRALTGPARLSTDGDAVLATLPTTTQAVDRTGRRRWAADLVLVDPPVPGPDGLWALTATELVRLDAAGAVAARFDAGPSPRGPVVVGDRWLAWVTAEGARTSEGWTLLAGGTPAGPPAADGDTLYVATADGRVTAGTATGRAWSVALGVPLLDGPTLDADRLYLPYAARGGEPGGVVALGRDGVERWRTPTRDQPVGLAVRTRVLVTDRDGRLYGLDPTTGAWRWEAEATGAWITPPLLAGSVVLAATADDRLWAIDADDGGVRWNRPFDAAVVGGPVLVGDQAVVALADGRLVALADPPAGGAR